MRVFDILTTCAGLMKPNLLTALSKQVGSRGLTAKSSFFKELANFVSRKGKFWNIEPLLYDAYISGLLLYVASRYVGKGYLQLSNHLSLFNKAIANYKLKNESRISEASLKVPLQASIEIVRLYQAVLDDFLAITKLSLSQPLSDLLLYIDNNSLSFGATNLSPTESYDLPVNHTILNVIKQQSDNQFLSLLKNKPSLLLSSTNIYEKGPVAAFINDTDGSMFLSFANPIT